MRTTKRLLCLGKGAFFGMKLLGFLMAISLILAKDRQLREAF
jgi:hypothetical protein